MVKKAFDDWFWQLEGHHLLGERFYDEHKTHDEKRMFEWLQAAFEAGQQSAVKVCIEQCEKVAEEANATAQGIYVTETGKLAHQGMWAGAKTCAGTIANQFGVNDEVAV